MGLWKDLIEGHKILKSRHNLNQFQSRADDKASEHELKLQINALGTDVGNDFFPNMEHLQHAAKPSKVIVDIEDIIIVNYERNKTLRTELIILRWTK